MPPAARAVVDARLGVAELGWRTCQARKVGKPNEFGKLVQVHEAENQIITHFEVYDGRPSDQHLLLPAVQAHQRKLGRVPRLVAADAGYLAC